MFENSTVMLGLVCVRDGHGSKFAEHNPTQPILSMTQPNRTQHMIEKYGLNPT